MKISCKNIFLCLTAALLLAGCAGEHDPYANYRQDDAASLFAKAEYYLAKKNEAKAIEVLEALEILYPFGGHAEQTQLYLLYAYYKENDLGAVAATADRYIRLYPRGDALSYVYYMKARANFNNQKPFLYRVFQQDRAHRDLTLARQSFRDFKYVAERFPQSAYAGHAQQQLAFLLDMLARAEYYAGDYYYRRGAYVAAANRGAYIVDNYPQSTETARALALMVKSYRQLQLNDKAEDALRVLELNFPDSAELHAASAPLKSKKSRIPFVKSRG